MPQCTQLSLLLKQARTKLGLGQRRMAQKLGVSHSAYTRYETGERWPSSKAISKLKGLLNIPEHIPLNGNGGPLVIEPLDLDGSKQSYLQHKWVQDRSSLKRKLARMNQRFLHAVAMRSVQAEELHAINHHLEPAREILQFLLKKSNNADVIAIQQARVDELTQQRQRAEISPVFLTNIELHSLAAKIEVLTLELNWLNEKLKDWDTTR